MEHQNEQAWWNIQRSAKYLNMSVAFVRKAVRQKRIPFVRVGTKVLRFRKQDLDRWLESNRSGGETGTAITRPRLRHAALIVNPRREALVNVSLR